MRIRFFQAVWLMPAFVLLSQGQSIWAQSSEIEQHLRQGEAALRANEIEVAGREFRTALTLDPASVRARTNLGVIYFRQADCPNAAEQFKRVLRIQPSLVKAEALWGICERRMGNKSGRKLLEDSFLKLRDVDLRSQVGMELIGIYYGEGNIERAVSTCQKLVEISPENPEILYTAQRLYNELADQTLNKLAILAPNSARMQEVIAERLINNGDLSSAIVHYKKALEIDPRLRGVHYELAEAFLELSRSDPEMRNAAEQEIEEARNVDGDSSTLECLLGKIALLENDLARSNSYYRKAFQLDPGNADAQLGLGRVLMMMDRPEEARKYLQMAVRSDPLNSSAHYRLAMADRKLGFTEEAQKEARLTDEIKRTKLNVEKLYQQMHKQAKEEDDTERPD